MEKTNYSKICDDVCLFVCWSLTSLCHSNGHIETMPAREINPFTALTRIRSQFLKSVMRGHLNKCPYMAGVPSSQVHFNVKVHFGSQKVQFRHLDRCPLVTGFNVPDYHCSYVTHVKYGTVTMESTS